MAEKMWFLQWKSSIIGANPVVFAGTAYASNLYPVRSHAPPCYQFACDFKMQASRSANTFPAICTGNEIPTSGYLELERNAWNWHFQYSYSGTERTHWHTWNLTVILALWGLTLTAPVLIRPLKIDWGTWGQKMKNCQFSEPGTSLFSRDTRHISKRPFCATVDILLVL